MYKILCLIPARSGSKGIENKNIKMFKGKPLMAWSIGQAIECKYRDSMRIIVSTDSPEYAEGGKAAWGGSFLSESRIQKCEHKITIINHKLIIIY